MAKRRKPAPSDFSVEQEIRRGDERFVRRQIEKEERAKERADRKAAKEAFRSLVKTLK